MPPAGWTNPITVPAGRTQTGVDPQRLIPSRSDLIRSRLDDQVRLLRTGTPRFTPVR